MRRLRGLGIGMNAHVGKIMSEARAEEAESRRIQRSRAPEAPGAARRCPTKVGPDEAAGLALLHSRLVKTNKPSGQW